MNYTLLFLLIFSLMGTFLFGQNPFEGQIIYDWKIGQVDPEGENYTFESSDSTYQIYRIKEGKYRSDIKGKFEMTQYYVGDDSLFMTLPVFKRLIWQPVSENPDSLISFEMVPDAEEVLGYLCSLLRIKSKAGTYEYYYHPDFAVTPEAFRVHEFGFWKFCAEKAGALPLKMKSISEEGYTVITAREATPMKLPDDIFTLPNLPRMRARN